MDLLTNKMSFHERLKRHIKKPVSREQIKQLQLEDERKFAKEVEQRLAQRRLNRLFGNSAIPELYLSCSLDNYIVTTDMQKDVKTFAERYIATFDSQPRSFVFSGTTGTGKNHLASAICIALMNKGYSCLLISMPDLMMRLRATYDKDSKVSEKQFFDDLIALDLLVLDEIGISRGSKNDDISLNHLVESRISNRKPTGMLTNLNHKQFHQSVGERVYDRMKTGFWKTLNWNSYR